MRELILHIGMNKTGSTTLQRALDGLDDDGLLYPRLGSADHGYALVLAYRTALPSFFAPLSPDRHAVERQACRKRVRAAYGLDSRSVVLSSEFLSIFRDVTDIATLVQDASPHFDRIRAIGYVRDPVGYMTSGLQEAARRNDVPDDGLRTLYPRYRPRLQPWLDRLGPENVDLVRFDPETFRGGDLVADFAHRLGISAENLAQPGNINPSLSAEAVAVLLAYHRHLGARPAPERRDAWRHGRLLTALQTFGASRLALDPAVMEKFLAARRHDVDWAEAQIGEAFGNRCFTDGRVFAGPADLRAFGEGLATPLAEWARGISPRVDVAGKGVAEILGAVVAAQTALPSTERVVRSLYRRLRGR
ncbi:MAG: hypothetical protein WBA67_14680 [Jannaschia sp.]